MWGVPLCAISVLHEVTLVLLLGRQQIVSWHDLTGLQQAMNDSVINKRSLVSICLDICCRFYSRHAQMHDEGHQQAQMQIFSPSF